MSNHYQDLKDKASARIEAEHALTRKWSHMRDSHPVEWERKSEAFRNEYDRRWRISILRREQSKQGE